MSVPWTAILVIGLCTKWKTQTSDDSDETQLADIGTNIHENLSTVILNDVLYLIVFHSRPLTHFVKLHIHVA